MATRPGLTLLVVFLLALLGYDIGRHVLTNEDVPTFFVEETAIVRVALEGDWTQSGVYQISDDLTVAGVINMTDLSVATNLQQHMLLEPPLNSGERLTLKVVEGSVLDYSRNWMPASQRVTLNIPLHPDRMTKDDWDYLPGVGERLAGVIMADRQNNGDFERFEKIRRVKGIGPGRIKLWKRFF